MIIDAFSTSLEGGAGVEALALHHKLLERGVDSRLWYRDFGDKQPPLHERPDIHNVRPLPHVHHPNPLTRVWDFLRRLPRRVKLRRQRQRLARDYINCAEGYSIARCYYDTPYRRTYFQGDLVHLHWVSHLLDVPTFFPSLPANMPVVWTLHDMNPFTGGCHYAFDCELFTATCSPCPQLTSAGARRINEETYAINAAAYRHANLHVVTPSRWLEAHARRSSLLAGAASFQTIPCAIDLDKFTPGNRRQLRHKWGLPSDRTLICLGAMSLSNPRKGVRFLLEALGRLPGKEKLLVVTIGADEAPECELPLPPMHPCGFLTPNQVAEIYSASDLFVAASLADNLPLTLIEAQGCGVPCVAFEVGGIGEIILPGETGLLSPVRDVAHLAEQIQFLIKHPGERSLMGANARRHACARFDRKQQAQSYEALYRHLLETRSNP